MTRPVFGVDDPPAESREPMSYVARGACGHIVIRVTDSRREALGDFVRFGLAGLTVERIPSTVARDEGLCPCPKPEQVGAGL